MFMEIISRKMASKTGGPNLTRSPKQMAQNMVAKLDYESLIFVFAVKNAKKKMFK